MFLPAAALAGDNNRADLLQLATGSTGNTLTIDQSQASNSLVAGDPLGQLSSPGLVPAQQVGDGNSATLTLSGDGSRAALEQGLVTAPAFDNQAVAVIAGLAGFGAIQQLGSGNSASLSVTSQDGQSPAQGLIVQEGDRNTALLTVEGVNINGTLRQTGSDNANTLNVSGQDSSVTFIQNGSNLVNPANVPGVSVFTNAGNITITQTTFGAP
jgi:hypothetical protein